MLRKRCAKCPGALKVKSHARRRNTNMHTKIHMEKTRIQSGSHNVCILLHIRTVNLFFYFFQNNVPLFYFFFVILKMPLALLIKERLWQGFRSVLQSRIHNKCRSFFNFKIQAQCWKLYCFVAGPSSCHLHFMHIYIWCTHLTVP